MSETSPEVARALARAQTMPGRMGLAYAAVRRTFGKVFSPLVTAVLFGGLRVSVAVGMVCDNLLPRLRRTTIEAPLIIVGSPRTGTTFLQRFLHKHQFGVGVELWRMLYPSLLLQKLIRPLLPLLERVSPARHHSTAAHATGLTSVETDDAAVFLRYFDGFFLYGFLLAWAEHDLRQVVDPAARDTADRDFAWLRKVWRRNVAGTDQRRVVAKMFSLSMRLPAFLREFPDARILYMVRDPVDVLPSGLSLVTGVLDKRFGFWNLPADLRQQYIDRLYAAFVELLSRFHSQWQSGAIDRERVLIVRYDRMMAEFETVMAEIVAHAGIDLTAAQREAIASTAEAQRNYSSKHRYDLAKFGLTAEQIRRDCAFVYATYGVPQR